MTRQLAPHPSAKPKRPPGQDGKVPRRRWTARTRRDFFVFLAMALPNLVLIAVFTYRPLFSNIYYSTLDWTLGSPTATVVGLANYATFFNSNDAPKVLGTTAVFTLVTVGGSMILGLLVALALPTRRALRTRPVAAIGYE